MDSKSVQLYCGDIGNKLITGKNNMRWIRQQSKKLSHEYMNTSPREFLEIFCFNLTFFFVLTQTILYLIVTDLKFSTENEGFHVYFSDFSLFPSKMHTILL